MQVATDIAATIRGLRAKLHLSQPAPFREYVIVHELLHLKVPNHGKLFKSLLRAYLPDYESIHQQLAANDTVAGKTL